MWINLNINWERNLTDYEIYTEAEHPYVTIVVNSDITRELALAFVKAGTEEAIRQELSGILVDLSCVNSVESVLGNYELAQQMDGEGIPRHIRIAGVTAPGDTSHDFMEITTFNRGFNVRLFRSMEEATQWLTDGHRPIKL